MKPTDDFDPPPGQPVQLAPGLRRLVAPNPSPMTFRGTNTYLVGTTDMAVIDPGPLSEDHLSAILRAVEPGQRISHVFVTHTHLDHSPLARPLAERTGAQVFAFGAARAGRSAVMRDLAATGEIGGGEGVDEAFRPDIELQDGQFVDGDGWRLEILHTPGHIGNHICLGWGDVCFTADHVMGWASSLVSPPDGDLTDFMASCRRLSDRRWSVFHPGHGAPVTEPASRLDWLMSHRRAREAAILAELARGPSTAHALAMLIYRDTPTALLGAAKRNVLAHLIDLHGKSRVQPIGRLSADATFRLL